MLITCFKFHRCEGTWNSNVMLTSNFFFYFCARGKCYILCLETLSLSSVSFSPDFSLFLHLHNVAPASLHPDQPLFSLPIPNTFSINPSLSQSLYDNLPYPSISPHIVYFLPLPLQRQLLPSPSPLQFPLWAIVCVIFRSCNFADEPSFSLNFVFAMKIYRFSYYSFLTLLVS